MALHVVNPFYPTMTESDYPVASSTVFVEWLTRFASALEAADADAVASMFLPHGWFKDVLTFTWDMRALRGPGKIASYLRDNIHHSSITSVKLDTDPYFTPHVIPGSADSMIESAFRFETPIADGRGYVQLARDQGTWQALLVCMTLVDLKGHEELVAPLEWEEEANGRPWSELHAERRRRNESDPYALIIGAGQTGLQVAARFHRMGIPTLVVDKNNRVGDNWRKRYDTLALHTPKKHHPLLYQPFPSHWPTYTPRDKLADWLESYAVHQELTVWTKSSPIDKPVWDHGSQRWNVTINHDGTHVQLRPAHIILATGTLGAPYIPHIPNRNLFKGMVIHSSSYVSAKSYKDKDVVVVGAGNSSIDICQDCVVEGAKSVTMVQRSSTCVTNRKHVAEGMNRFWVDGDPTAVGDFKFGSLPLGMLKEYMISHQEETWALDTELHAKLRKGGVSLNIGPEGQGQFILVFERCGGYWLDKGGADLIESGDIKVKQGVAPTAFSSSGLTLTDGTELHADVVILATGYRNVRETCAELLGTDVVDRTSDIYGLDAEGELNGSYRPCGHPGLWFATGDFFHSRYMSKHLAIQLKARQLGLINDSLRPSL